MLRTVDRKVNFPDNGRGLGLIPGEDKFKVLSRPQEELEKSEDHSKEQSQGVGGMSL